MDESIGSRIKKRRKDLHFTQMQMQEKTGISTGNLSEIERGIKLPSITSLIKIANVLHCSSDSLIYGDSKESIEPSINNQDNNFFNISSKTKSFLKIFNQLSSEDQDEIIAISKMKYERNINRKKLSPSDQKDSAFTA